MSERVKDINKKDVESECEAWARFLYEQYTENKLKELTIKQEEK